MSSAMPKPSPKKTKSARKLTPETSPEGFFSPRRARSKIERGLIFAVIGAVGIVAMLLPTIFYQAPQAKLQVAGKTVKLDIAKSEEARAKGLGGRESMADDQGMLFVFDQPAKECFWMKDMQFPIDIIWLNTAKQVVHVERNLSPETYPASYCPKLPAKYVVELNAGQAEKLDISPGDTLKL